VPATGSCLCGAVRASVDGPLRDVVNCHCGQCRKWTGHHVAATAAWKRDVSLDDPENLLRWYRSSNSAKRGFCRRCGSNLFWERDGADTLTIMAGMIDGPTGLRTRAEIHTADKGDYYPLQHPAVDRYAQSGHDVKL
jgi:hypothetical protein